MASAMVQKAEDPSTAMNTHFESTSSCSTRWFRAQESVGAFGLPPDVQFANNGPDMHHQRSGATMAGVDDVSEMSSSDARHENLGPAERAEIGVIACGRPTSSPRGAKVSCATLRSLVECDWLVELSEARPSGHVVREACRMVGPDPKGDRSPPPRAS